MNETKIVRALISGFIGACAVTLLNLGAQRLSPSAPKLDVLGIRALAAGIAGMGVKPPHGDKLRASALAGDLVANTIYYSLVGSGESKSGTWLRATLLGAAAGLGAAFLPPYLGLGKQPTPNRTVTRLLTFFWYFYGAVAAAAAARTLSGDSESSASDVNMPQSVSDLTVWRF
jgi:hypothetical protein